MDTTYYNFNVRRIKVSGGADLLTVVPTLAPAPAHEEKGQILDFNRCRQQLETRRSWDALVETAQSPLEAEQPSLLESRAPLPRKEHAATILELAASGAVILVSIAAIAAFLGLV